MWIPKTEKEIIEATIRGDLEETLTFDAKSEIPAKNIDTAKDVSALANTSGGVLLYGLCEDANQRLTILRPLVLQGQRERIEQIIRTSIDEVPSFNISTITTANDLSRGYVIVVVPPSERAPHMVVAKGERRFYGRGETGNYILNQSDIARLYERRQISNADILPLLDQTIGRSPLPPSETSAHLHVIARPVLSDEDIFAKALAAYTNADNLLRDLITSAARSQTFRSDLPPRFTQPPDGWTIRTEGYLGRLRIPNENDPRRDAHTLNVQINLDGSGYLFCGRAAETDNRQAYPIKWFYSLVVAANTTRLLALLGDLYERAGYLGMVDIAVGLTGLERSCPYESAKEFDWFPRYVESSYRKTLRVAARALKDDPKRSAAELLMPLINAISQGKDDPFNLS